MHYLISGLVIVTGVIAGSVGVATASSRLRVACRAYHKTATLYASMPEGWSSWFLGGFSELTLGTHWLWAGLALLGWLIAGVGFVSLGFRLLTSTP